MTSTTVDAFVDPRCPWAWITTQWLLEVEQVRPVEIRFRVMSLSVLNEGREVPEHYRQAQIDGWGPVRVCVAAARRYGPSVLRPLYLAMGRQIHHDRAGLGPDMIRAALAGAGLAADLADVADTTDVDGDLRAAHDAGTAAAGTAVGTPVLRIHGPDAPPVAFFGPVLSPAPRGDAAVRLWDALVTLAGTDGFFELKRHRDRDPVFAGPVAAETARAR